MTHFTGALPRPSRAFLSLGQAGATKLSTTNLPSGPLRTTTLPPGPESIVTSPASLCVSRGAALNLARILASRSAAEGVRRASPAAEARGRKALPARVAEVSNISRRDVCSALTHLPGRQLLIVHRVLIFRKRCGCPKLILTVPLCAEGHPGEAARYPLVPTWELLYAKLRRPMRPAWNEE